ncbi:MAG: hypothetical protein CVV56_05745 [Tenericutes bacterium HGW-Tenericutes-1]|jgi:UDP-N-acetylglucosamine:LPS N-acetylglucosamine transferase|nr:MAG: hypothetical protein CVV56_05745 [Tenericutes bacterium HGW-Tenericutes-1]PKM56553.1 MAG: hypothetical protein CVU98_10640 [Firmicutes bacterium HGW-Firmicutes-3]
MMDKTKVIFGNTISPKVIIKANKSKAKFIKKFGDDSKCVYHMSAEPNQTLLNLNVSNLVSSDTPLILPEKSIVIGNIRMGFGHYRIAIAFASCANALGYKPLWFDLSGFPESVGSKVIKHQNDLYSMGSRWSQKYKLFNKFFWEPLNSEGFRKIDYNAVDQKNSEIYIPMYNDFPKDIPFIGTHVWPSQGAIHSGLSQVINAIPDNWPMALHLAEGSIHTVQTPFAYLGYKLLNGMAKTTLLEMPKGSIYETGYYIDHELVSNIEVDTEARLKRIQQNKPLRILLPVGGAGAGKDIFKCVLEYLMPFIKTRKVQLFINFGDHLNVWYYLKDAISDLDNLTEKYFDSYDKYQELVSNVDSLNGGIYAIYHKDIFEAVYSTNLIMRFMDLIVTKPSELSYYPIPKFFIKRVGGHEAYGAIHSSEMGDGTFECDTLDKITMMLSSLISNKEILLSMNHNILKLNKINKYHGAYKVIELATKK